MGFKLFCFYSSQLSAFCLTISESMTDGEFKEAGLLCFSSFSLLSISDC